MALGSSFQPQPWVRATHRVLLLRLAEHVSLPEQGAGMQMAAVKVVTAPTTERMRRGKVQPRLGCRNPAPPGALLSAQGGRGQGKQREAAVGTPPLSLRSTMVLCFCGPGLQIPSSPSFQAVSLQLKAAFPLGLLSKSHVPAPSPLSALAKICLHPGRAGLCLTSSL